MSNVGKPARTLLLTLILLWATLSSALGDEFENFDQAWTRGDLAAAQQAAEALPEGLSRALAQAQLAREGLRPSLAWSYLTTIKPADLPPQLASRYFRLRAQLGSASGAKLARRDLKESLSRAQSAQEKALALQATIGFLVEWEQPAEAQKQLRALLLLPGSERLARESAATLALGDGQAEQAILGLESLARDADERSTPLLALGYRLEQANCWSQLDQGERSRNLRRQCAEQAIRLGQPQLAARALRAMLPSAQLSQRFLPKDRADFLALLQQLPRSAERTLLLTDLGFTPPRTPGLLEQALEESLDCDPLVQAYARFHYAVRLRTVDKNRARIELEAVKSLLEPYQDAWLAGDRWSVDRIALFNELGTIYRVVGNPEKAKASNEKALELSAQHAPIFQRQAVLAEQLVAAISALDAARCRSVWENVLADFDRAKPSEMVALLPQASSAFSVAFNALEDELIGFNHWSPAGPLERELADSLRGRPGLVARYFDSCDHALARARRVDDVNQGRDILYYRAKTLAFLGQYSEAERVLEQCQSVENSPTGGQRARLLILRGQILARTGRLDDVHLAELARLTEDGIENPTEKRPLRALLAKEALRAGRPAQALPLIERALAERTAVPLQLLKAKALVALNRRPEAIALLETVRQYQYRRVDRLLSLLLAQSGKVEAALALSEELLRRSDTASSPFTKASALVDRAQIEGYGGTPARRAALYREALREFLSARAKLDPLLAKELFVTSAVGRRILDGLPPDEAKAALLAQPAEPTSVATDQRAALLLALQSLHLQEPAQQELQGLMTTDFPALEKTLSADTLLLYPLVLDHGVAWVYLTQHSSGLKLSAIARQDLEARVAGLLQACSTPSSDLVFLRQLSRSLADSLLEPVSDLMQSKKNLVIVPTGPLARLPFELLVDRQDRYLIDSYSISYRLSLGPVGPPVRPLDADRLLIYDDEAGLAGARAEAQAVNALLSPVILNSENWNLQAFGQSAKTASLIHVAAHGLSQHDDAVSRLSMGKVGLSREDIEGLQLAPGSLVVLGACSGARANVAFGTRKKSLAAAFLDAGASAAVGAYWEVDDQSSNIFFQTFYKGLLKGESTQSVLTQTKRAWLADPAFSHPFFWAPYVLYEAGATAF
jgi:CHAT domain-containing protein